jgi:hypothetical protein
MSYHLVHTVASYICSGNDNHFVRLEFSAGIYIQQIFGCQLLISHNVVECIRRLVFGTFGYTYRNEHNRHRFFKHHRGSVDNFSAKTDKHCGCRFNDKRIVGIGFRTFYAAFG